MAGFCVRRMLAADRERASPGCSPGVSMAPAPGPGRGMVCPE